MKQILAASLLVLVAAVKSYSQEFNFSCVTPFTEEAEFRNQITDDEDLMEFLDLYVYDASTYNIDLSHVYDGTIIFEWDLTPYSSRIGQAVGICNDTKVHLIINRDWWRSNSFRLKLQVFYHEIGHDILNSNHVYTGREIMRSGLGQIRHFEDFRGSRSWMFRSYRDGRHTSGPLNIPPYCETPGIN